jgi:WD40 repeat protein
MMRISQRAALVCAAGLFAVLLSFGIDVGAQEKDKKIDKKEEKKIDDKAKKDDKKTADKGKDNKGKDDKGKDDKGKDDKGKDDKGKDDKGKDDKGKNDDKKEEKKKEEYKPDMAQLELKGHKFWIYAIGFSEDGKTLASVGKDRKAKLWDIGGKKELNTLDGDSDKMQGLAYSHGVVYVIDSKMIKTKVTEKGKDKEKDKEKEVKVRQYEIRVWDAKAGKERPPLKGHTDWIRCVAVDRDGKTLYSGGDDDTVIAWDLDKGKEITTIKAHTAPVMAVAVSKDGSMLATAGADGSVKIWDKAGKELAAFKIETEEKKTDPKTKKETTAKVAARAFTCIAFSPDSKRLAAGNIDAFVKIWDVDGKKELQELKLPAGSGVWSLAYNPDGSRLATGDYDGTIKIWDGSGKDLRTIKAGSTSRDTITALAFSPDGSQLASGGLDALIKIWSVEPGKK